MKTAIHPTPNLVRRIDFSEVASDRLAPLLHREWLVTNGLGGYASGTISGALTWRYHGLLIAALPAPLGRTLMLNHLLESVQLPSGQIIPFGGGEHSTAEDASNYLTSFTLNN